MHSSLCCFVFSCFLSQYLLYDCCVVNFNCPSGTVFNEFNMSDLLYPLRVLSPKFREKTSEMCQEIVPAFVFFSLDMHGNDNLRLRPLVSLSLTKSTLQIDIIGFIPLALYYYFNTFIIITVFCSVVFLFGLYSVDANVNQP